MRTPSAWRLLMSTALITSGALVGAAQASDIEIPFERFVLDNGLTLVVHEDHKAPIVAINVWYHVGSKNEKLGKTGFAHLFEHLMFNGSENYNHDFFKPFDSVGATDMNGTTNFDRTNYFENVPTTALDMALWMESDRMGHLLGAIDQGKLDEQRGVVQNEKRQGENQPYGRAFRTIFENTYPNGHPYSWSVIGSLEDLDAASVDDVHEWFKTYYGAANAVLVVAGDVDAKEVHAKVEKYFGDIPSGPPVERQQAWVAKRTDSHRMTMQDRVPQARIYKAWNAPELGHPDDDYLDLVSDVLGSGKTSRLYKRLVYEDQVATDVSAFIYSRELGGLFIVQATAQPGQDLAAVEKALDEEVAKFIAEGPTASELERIKTGYRARFVRGIERIGGFGGKSDILAQSEVYEGSPDYYKTKLDRVAKATPKHVHEAGRAWLTSGDFTLEVVPFPEFSTVASGADRSKLPEPDGFPSVRFPEMQRAKLANGLELILVERKAVPVVNFQLLVDAGYAADQHAVPGTASLALNMMDEGTKTRTSLEISEQLDRLGANLSSGSNLDVSSVSLSALKDNLAASLDIYADVILNPSFPESDLGRLKQQQIAGIKSEKTTPFQMGLRVLPKLMYGDDHAYGMPFTGSGDEVSVSGLTSADLKKFHSTWFKPSNATMVVVGDTTMATLKPLLEARFKGWSGGDVPKKNIATVSHQAKPIVYLLDRPDSIQSVLFAGHIAPPKNNPNETAIEAMNEVLGGSFMARINMNLREDKHWSYGSRSVIVDARGQRPFLVFAPVQTDKTKESLAELVSELTGVVGDRPATEEELQRAKDSNTLSLPGRWETGNAVAGSIAEIVRFGLPETYWDQYAGNVRGLRLADVNKAARDTVHPDKIIWVVVGDRAKIEDGIRELNLGELRLLDADGNPITRSAEMRK